MTRFTDLSIQGFRRLHDVQLPLRPLSVMIGANGTGKTSVLDVLSLLAKSAQGKLNEALADLSGLSSVHTYDKEGDVQFGISMTMPNQEPLEYSLSLRALGIDYQVAEEKLSQVRPQKWLGKGVKKTSYDEPFKHIDSHGTDIKYFGVDARKLVRPTWEHSPLESSLSQVPKMFQEPEDFRNRLASSTFYHVLNVDPRSPVRPARTRARH